MTTTHATKSSTSTKSNASTKSSTPMKSEKSKKSHHADPAKPATHTTEVSMKAIVPEVATASVTASVASSASSAAPAPNPLLAGLPSEEAIATAAAALDDVAAMLGDNATPLSVQQRRRSLKFKKGGEPIATLLAGLGLRYAVNLPGVDPQAILAHATLAQRLQDLDAKLRGVSQLVSDTVRSSKTESWQGTTALYTALTRASARTPALQTELEPAVAFFKKPPTPPGPKPPKPKPSAKRVKAAQAVLAAAEAATSVATGTAATASQGSTPAVATAVTGK